jgi:hypothetical protein
MQRRQLSGALGVALGAILVISALSLSDPGWGFFSHTECKIGPSLGNLTVWVPSTVVAAPYLGSVSGSVVVWSKLPSGTDSAQSGTNAVNGSITAFILGFENWTVFSQQNTSVAGPGDQAACTTPMVAYFSPNGPGGERHGGISSWPMYTQLVSDTGLGSGLNGSDLCEQVQTSTYQSCGVGAQFDMNFTHASGSVNTCGSSSSQMLHIFGERWPVTARFLQGGHSYPVPLDPSGENSANFANGSFAWYNSTFTAGGGIWQYDNLAETSNTGAGLVFAYSPCP